MLGPVVDVLARVGPWGLLVLASLAATWAYATDRVVSAGRHAEMVEDRDFWRETAVVALNLGEAAARRDREAT